ncbi:cupin domain-containing protein [Bacillus cereus]|nr:cupin domain-containing protein [Bacillus cereus]
MIKDFNLKTINLDTITKDITDEYVNFVVSDVNDHCLRIAVFSGEYKWHYHSNSDELFMVLEGELLIDFKDKETAILKSNDTLLIPAGTIHRTRAKQRTVNLCFENKNADTVIVDE